MDESLVATSLNQAQMDLNYWSAGNQVYQQQLALQQNKAQTLGAYGNFSGYLDLGYSQDQIDQMYKVWAAQNPLLAAALGGGYGYGYGYGSGGGSGGKVSSGGGTPPKDDTPPDDTSKKTTGNSLQLGMAWGTDSVGNVNKVSVKNEKTGVTTLMPITKVQQLMKSGRVREMHSGGKIIYIDRG